MVQATESSGSAALRVMMKSEGMVIAFPKGHEPYACTCQWCIQILALLERLGLLSE